MNKCILWLGVWGMLFLSSCKKEPTQITLAALIGQWTELSPCHSPYNDCLIIVFGSDGRAYTRNPYVVNTPFKLSGNIITLNDQLKWGPSVPDNSMSYAIDGDSAKLTIHSFYTPNSALGVNKSTDIYLTKN